MTLPAHKILLLIICIFLPSLTTAEVVDRSVAIVNDDIITLSEVNELGKPFFQQVAKEAPADQLEQALQQARRTVIEKLIEKKLLLQQAAELRISVSDSEVENSLQRILVKNNSTIENFRQDIAAAGMSESLYRENLREQILSSKLINYEVRSQVIIPEERIIDYYDNHYTEQVGEGGYYLLQIGCNWGTNNQNETVATKAEAKEKAERIRNLAAAGQDFKELASQHSDMPSRVDNGDLGVFKEHEMAPYMRKAVIGLQPGEISKVIETPSGYQFFQLLSRQEGQIITKVPYESVKESIREALYQEKMQQRYESWLKEIRANAYIKIL